LCPACPFWAHRQRPVDAPTTSVAAIASYEPDQWEALLASAADRDQLEDTWEEWNAGAEKLIAGLEAKSILWIRVQLDVEEIKQFCEEQGVPNDGKARAALTTRKAELESRYFHGWERPEKFRAVLQSSEVGIGLAPPALRRGIWVVCLEGVAL
jgi:hypothetical protein